ncbi:transcriptional regulator [Thioclava sp. JM3]|uniref:Transcriptional regulator n=1 Tax=Thioclava nitratireducens TaxID=1915078 RepID=A0ABM6ILL0_9RHOB|nr:MULTISPECIES: response regulator transcription factor [Thioclava]AQS49692.1 transcriptional regulator [Thioclava nitratireducens]OWY15733.1 transcriptional regulator [Thioclava sp. JM3]
MNIYVFEPRDGRVRGLLGELESVGLQPVLVPASFFASDLSTLNQKGVDTRAILIGDCPEVTEYIRAIRSCGCRNPVLVMRDFKNSRDASEALDAGADDVMVSPIKGIEALSRINSIIRRSYGHAAESISVGEITAFFDGRDPLVSGVRLKLSNREHAIFQHLALNANKVIAKGAIYDAVYGMSDDQPFDKVIDVYICKLRKKIADAAESGHQYIETVYGRGYKFSELDSTSDVKIAAYEQTDSRRTVAAR